MTRIVSIEEAGNRFKDGMLIATTGGNERSSMALTREIVRRGIKDLTLVFTPAGGIQGDMLIGAGAVKAIDTGSLTFGERGFAPNYRRVAKEGGIAALDSTWPVTLTGLQAGANGVPFIPSRGVIGTDLVELHPNWKIIEDPYNEGHDILLVPAIRPDIAMIHAFKADKNGNVLAPGYEDRMIAQASDKVLVTVEEIVDYDLSEDPRGGHLIPWPFISLVIHTPKGSHPGGMKPYYEADNDHFSRYMEASKTADGFNAYLDEFVRGHTEDEYREMVTRVAVPA